MLKSCVNIRCFHIEEHVQQDKQQNNCTIQNINTFRYFSINKLKQNTGNKMVKKSAIINKQLYHFQMVGKVKNSLLVSKQL